MKKARKSQICQPHDSRELFLSDFHKFFYLIFGNEAEYMFENAEADDMIVAMGGGNGAHTEKGVILDFHLGGKVEFADQASNGWREEAAPAVGLQALVLKVGGGGVLETAVDDVAVLLGIGTGSDEGTTDNAKDYQCND